EELGGYRVLREIGRGGMGVVYEAEHVALRRRVALKVLPPGLARDPARLERFRREARAAARLHHTHIVPLFEAGQDRGLCLLAMQLIDGRGLDQLPGPVAPREAARLAAQAADALAYAHGQGVVHRDVKPGNLLLDAAGNVWVTDF